MNKKYSNRYVLLIALLGLAFTACKREKKQEGTTDNVVTEAETEAISRLKISDNQRYFITEEGEPFFWLGDTAWLLFNKLKREEADAYLEDRKEKGFNVIQVMTLHSLNAVNAYGDTALVKENVAKPVTTPGNRFENEKEYDFWDHVDYIVESAEKKGLYMAMVPVWGSNVKAGKVSEEEAGEYARFLAERYKDNNNVIWLNGGDTFGNEYTEVWKNLGKTLKDNNPDKLVTFHPRGRTQSSDWFHNEPWMDFNMFQSGHRRYDQDDSEKGYGEDNWRYVEVDYGLKPVKPTLDGEPSYEGIPQGLHDTTQSFWKDKDVRRYAYWSVFAGATGYTYGHSSVMQMHRPQDEGSAYGNKKYWTEAIDDPGAGQMKYVKQLMLKYPYFERIPDQSIVAGQGEKYDYQAATRGENYVLVYSYNGRNITVNMGKIQGDEVEASWFNPRNGETQEIDTFKNEGKQEFDPPGKKEDGNDWVLVLTSA